MRETKRNVTAVDTKSLSKRLYPTTPFQLDFSPLLPFLGRKISSILFLRFLYEWTETNPHLLRALLRAYYVVWYIKKIAHTSFVYARAIYDSITRNNSYTLGVPP